MPLPKSAELFFGINLTDEQREYADSIFDNKITFVNAKAGTGKSQPVSEEVLTPTGWVKMGDIEPGDLVMSMSGSATKVTSIHPQGALDVYEIKFSDGSSTRCSLDHLWLTKDNKEFSSGAEWSAKTTEEIINTLLYRGNRKNHRIPLTEPINFTSREVLIDPYLLGVLLGDGGMSAGSVFLTNENEEIINDIKKRLPSDTEIKHKIDTTYSFNKKVPGNKRNSLCILLDSYGVLGLNSYTKFVPEDYLFNTIDVRLNVLRGLMDTDGTIDYRTGKSATFTTSSEKLRDAVVFLVRSLGGVAAVWEKTPKYTYKGEKLTGATSYNVQMNLPNGINPFKFSKKSSIYSPNLKYIPTRMVESIRKIGKEECQCISVEDESKSYITKDFIVTHNTTLAVGCAKILGKPLVYTFSPVEEGSIGFTPGTVEEKESKYITPLLDALEEIGEDARFALKSENNPEMINDNAWIEAKSHTFLRGSNIKDSTLIIDESQNLTRGELKKVLSRVHDSTTVIVIGHDGQNDLKNPSKSGFVPYLNHFKDEPYAKVCALSVNFRGDVAKHADELEW